jgi:hypothetical protein
MRFPRFLLALPILSYLLLLAAPARAQLDIDPTLERGLKPYGAFEGGAIDSVSMTNGNLNLHIPLLSYPQRGGKLHLGFFIKFDNNSYSYSIAGTGCSQKPYVCGWGTYINGALMEIVPDLNVNVFVSGVIPPSNGPYATIKTTDGSQHEMGATSSNWMTVDATGWLCLNSCATVIGRFRNLVLSGGLRQSPQRPYRPAHHRQRHQNRHLLFRSSGQSHPSGLPDRSHRKLHV